ncbi:hypothetical protein N2152v2_009995 [Parachlorella kessleri]
MPYSTHQADLDVEDQLLSYVARRQNGTTALAKAVVARTVDRYKAAVWVLQNFAPTSSRFWDAFEALDEALEGLQEGFPGELDYYFGPSQFDELVLPALRGALPGGSAGGRPVGRMASFASDMLLHVDCESLSLDQQQAALMERPAPRSLHILLIPQQRDGPLSVEQQQAALTELTRTLAAVKTELAAAGANTVPEVRLCMLNVIAKLLVLRTRRGCTEEPDRQVHMPLAAQAARQGVLKEALRMLEDNYKNLLVSDLAQRGYVPSEEDASDADMLFLAHRLVTGLLVTADYASAASVGSWAAKRPRLVKGLLDRLSRPASEHNLSTVCLTLRLVGQLANASPELVAAMQAGGVAGLLERQDAVLFAGMSPLEATMWADRLCCDPTLVGTLPVCYWDPLTESGVKFLPPHKRRLPAEQAQQQGQGGQQWEEEQQQGQGQGRPVSAEVAARLQAVADEVAGRMRAAAAADGAPGTDARLGPGQGTPEELNALPVRALKARLQALGIDCGSCTEKQDLVELLLIGGRWHGQPVVAQRGDCPSPCDRVGSGSVSERSCSAGSSSRAQQAAAVPALQARQAQPAQQQRQARQPAPGAVEGALAPAPKRCACCGATSGPGTKLKRSAYWTA